MESVITAVPSDSQIIQLAPMQQLVEAVDQEDDWTGITSSAARRKRQNRLNQRAYRRRKALEAHQSVLSEHDSMLQISTVSRMRDDFDKASLLLQKRHRLQLVNTLIQSLQSGNANNMHVVFPLSTDHLIPLIQFNVLRAFLTNMALLQILDTLPQDCGGYDFYRMPLCPAPEDVPPQLRPTALQKRVPHPHWVDTIPSPKLRDNFIRLAETIDEDELCSDFIGGLFEGDVDIDARGWIVWKDPWDMSGWEMTEGFVRKWGFVLKGCNDLLEATNRWRRMRGEEELAIEAEVLLGEDRPRVSLQGL